jgi:uncharacterized phage protein (TIGR02220 family)
MNEKLSFTLYNEIFRLIDTIQPKEKRNEFIGKILDFYFKDEKPNFNQNSFEEIIWLNISKPIISYKSKVLNGSKGGRPKKTESKTEMKSEIESESKTTSDVFVHVNVYDNILENKGYGEKKPFKEIIDYLNKKANTHFKYNSKTTQSKINARLNEGYVLDDFIAVIDKKFIEWNNTEFEQYLCPETLFGPKFEKYLNQKSTKTGNKPDWLKKDILEDKASDEEIKALEERLKRR